MLKFGSFASFWFFKTRFLSVALSLCRPGWSRTKRSTCLCLPKAGTEGLCHHISLEFGLFITVLVRIFETHSQHVTVVPHKWGPYNHGEAGGVVQCLYRARSWVWSPVPENQYKWVFCSFSHLQGEKDLCGGAFADKFLRGLLEFNLGVREITILHMSGSVALRGDEAIITFVKNLWDCKEDQLVAQPLCGCK